MDILQLKYFVAVADSGSFSEAAELMFSAQSTVSKQIASLEKELGLQLFDRSKRRISLTENGTIFLNHCRIILNDYQDMISDMTSISTKDDDGAVVYATTAMLPYNILSYISDFKHSAPWAHVTVEEFETENILRMLRDSECDIAVFRVGKFDETLYEKLPILLEKYVAVLPINHPLANEDEISLEQLKNDDFVLCRQNSCLHRYAVNACKSMGFEPNISATSNYTTNIFEMVGMNMGVSLLLEISSNYYMNEEYAKKIVIKPLKEVFIVEVAFARYKKHHHTRASLALWDFIKKSSEHKKFPAEALVKTLDNL